MVEIRKAAVIGAGVMGSGIAAHLANAGVEVVLLDIDATFAEAGVARQLKAGGFMEPDFAARVRTGATGTDMALLADADWIVEAVAERLDIKQGLYRAIETVRKPGAIVSSNTSTIPLAALTAGLPPAFAADFLVTHFFNPPRRMQLLELVAGKDTHPDTITTIAEFCDRRLGKEVVRCKDTPGFIANRIGNLWMVAAQNEAIGLGLDVEEADALISKPFGIPRTGIFGLLDLVGIDLMPMVLRSLQAALPPADAIHAYDAEPPLVARMVAEKRLGRKSGAGFVRLSADRKTREVTDLATGDYRPAHAVACPALDETKGEARALMTHPSQAGEYTARVMLATFAYAAALVPEIADGPDAVDAAMRTGYGWKQGPFELIDRLGAGWVAEQLDARKIAVPPYLARAVQAGGFYRIEGGTRLCLLPDGGMRPVMRPEGAITLADLALAGGPVAQWPAAALWDLGEGIACFEFRTKMGTFSEGLLDALNAALDVVERDFRALVIGSDAGVFSAGADLRVFLETVEHGGAEALGAFIDRGHQTFLRLKYAPFPVVGAAAGLALGGGCEVLLHSSALAPHAELAIGLVETKIGLVPGWGGCKEALLRLGDPLAAFRLVMGARMSGSAFEAQAEGLLRPTDRITMNRDRVLSEARAFACALAPGYAPPARPEAAPATEAQIAAMRADLAAEGVTPHDRTVGAALIDVLAPGGTEADILARERAAFVGLFATPETVARVRHMLTTGKPLRN